MVAWLEAERQKGTAVGATDALEALAKTWAQEIDNNHPFEKYYRAAAERMVRSMAELIAHETARHDRAEWSVPLGKHHILVTPDRVLVTGSPASESVSSAMSHTGGV